MLSKLILGLALLTSCIAHTARADQPSTKVPLIFDTDIGNDCDDVLALGVIHALQSRGECELLAVTITKDNEWAAPFTDAVNTFYGRGDIPIGVCRSGITDDDGKFNVLAKQADKYPHDLKSGKDAPDAVALLRETLAAQSDGSVVIAQVGFSTNLANLLKSEADDISPLSGSQLVQQKVRLLSIMAGAFTPITLGDGEPFEHREYNVVMDIPAARQLSQDWPTPIVWSGFEIGLALAYPYDSIVHDYNYAEYHPLSEAYRVYTEPDHDRPTWDLTSVLYAVRPDRGYFELSPPGRVSIDENGVTTFNRAEGGRDRYLINLEDQKCRVVEALVQLSSQPPNVK